MVWISLFVEHRFAFNTELRDDAGDPEFLWLAYGIEEERATGKAFIIYGIDV